MLLNYNVIMMMIADGSITAVANINKSYAQIDLRKWQKKNDDDDVSGANHHRTSIVWQLRVINGVMIKRF